MKFQTSGGLQVEADPTWYASFSPLEPREDRTYHDKEKEMSCVRVAACVLKELQSTQVASAQKK
jgi:hypothetical protein